MMQVTRCCPRFAVREWSRTAQAPGRCRQRASYARQASATQPEYPATQVVVLLQVEECYRAAIPEWRPCRERKPFVECEVFVCAACRSVQAAVSLRAWRRVGHFARTRKRHRGRRLLDESRIRHG